jgi:SAM-dependent methyltransferase
VIGVDLSEQMARRAATRLDGAVAADLRTLPFATGGIGGIAAFYSVIHLPRAQLGGAVREARRVLGPGGRLLVTAHAGTGEVALDEFLGAPVPFVASSFQLDELVEACTAAELDVVRAEQRPPYPDEHPTDRLAVEAVAR